MLALTVAALSFIGSLFLTERVAGLARRFGFIDRAGKEERKKVRAPTPLLGGAAVFLVFVAIVLGAKYLRLFPDGLVSWRAVLGLLAGGALLQIGGALDDRYDLRPAQQFVFPAAAVLVAVLSGLTVHAVKSPWGGMINLDWWNASASIAGQTVALSLPADLLSFLWILGITYTTKILDGLDGLVAGLSVIAAVLIYAVSLRPELNQPDTAVLAAAVAGAFGGFLVLNFPPAKIFLGEGGSTLAGFLIGSLAVISGSKVATTLLVLGAPVVDLALVIYGRLREKRRVFTGDASHFHFRLLTAGLSERKAVLLLYVVAIAFGSVGLLASTAGKAVTFLILAGLVWLASRHLKRFSPS